MGNMAYIIEARVDGFGNVLGDERVIGRFDKRVQSSSEVLDAWHNDKNEYIDGNSEYFMEASEVVHKGVDSMTIDYSLCSAPGVIWKARIIPSMMDEE